MEPTIHKGAIVYATPVKSSQLRVGDIVTFRTPPEYGSRAVTHRIVKVAPDDRGIRVFTTKGDHNKASDPWENITFNDNAAARYGFNVPYVGWFLSLTMAPAVRLFLIAIPAVGFGLFFLSKPFLDHRRRKQQFLVSDEPQVESQ
jgi:signal peptidase I